MQEKAISCLVSEIEWSGSALLQAWRRLRREAAPESHDEPTSHTNLHASEMLVQQKCVVHAS